MTEGNHEKNPNQLDQNQDLNTEFSEYESTVMNFDRRCSLCIQKIYHRHTSQSAEAGIRSFILNCSNDTTVSTREVPRVHASCDVIILSRTRSRFTQ